MSKFDTTKFIWAWLPPAAYEARDRIKTADDAVKFLADAVKAFAAGEAATKFGSDWRP